MECAHMWGFAITLADGSVYCRCVACNAPMPGKDTTTPKPATAEPPEWKGESVTWLGPNGSIYVMRGPHPDRPGVMVVDELVSTDPELPPACTHCGFHAPTWEASMEHAGPCGEKHRGLAQFIERRKAKREYAAVREMSCRHIQCEWCEHWTLPEEPCRCRIADRTLSKAVRQAPEIARAMLTPITFTARLGCRT